MLWNAISLVMIISDRNVLVKLVHQLRATGNRIVFTNGCFDILHKGHVEYLRQAKHYGDILIVGINSDTSVRKIKGGGRPVMPLESRLAVVDALKFVDIVVPFDEHTPVELIKLIKPDIHVKGGDYQEDELPETPIVKQLGGKVVIVPLVEGYSTTSIIEKIRRSHGVNCG